MRLLPLLLPFLATAVSATRFFIGAYSGQILSANLDDTTGAITLLSSTPASSPSPSWQELSPVDPQLLFTVEERAHSDDSKGAVSAYLIGSDGALTKLSTALGLLGPVSLGVSPDGKTIFTANYGASGVSAYCTDDGTGALQHLQDWTFELSSPGAVPSRQDAPHPHQALFDATGQFVVVPDLGADLLRIFSVDGKTFSQLSPVVVPPGTGPRHGAWFPPTGIPLFYYLVGELSNTVTVFAVSYPSSGGLKLTQIQRESTLPLGSTTTTSAAPNSTPSAAEIAITPGGRYVYVSNRNDKVFPDGHSVAIYSRQATTGLLTSIGWADSGEQTLRHIALDPSGRFLLVEGQDSNEIAVLPVDATTGKLGAAVGKFAVPGGPVCVTFEK
ncbi:Lactonase, 7-bladed beta-propeller-domain-containing protein [Sphaerosporella brunnea]|uniref:Lactonase, 7-bladed beta-propeller-domain-containing protein n=1 Tax=Sphaerosporella brunnea TaxID=1250544 RepID=A0A5J5EFT2_9PEZI|nr:Lactonase, 7-bladed beta-propeller-domain-containing protein [Sphaerosporella brunnea]